MKCIDPWLLNNRRQCPVCKRYVFPNNQNSDEEESNENTATERTPLIQSTDDNRSYGSLIFYFVFFFVIKIVFSKNVVFFRQQYLVFRIQLFQ